MDFSYTVDPYQRRERIRQLTSWWARGYLHVCRWRQPVLLQGALRSSQSTAVVVAQFHLGDIGSAAEIGRLRFLGQRCDEGWAGLRRHVLGKRWACRICMLYRGRN